MENIFIFTGILRLSSHRALADANRFFKQYVQDDPKTGNGAGYYNS